MPTVASREDDATYTLHFGGMFPVYCYPGGKTASKELDQSGTPVSIKLTVTNDDGKVDEWVYQSETYLKWKNAESSGARAPEDCGTEQSQGTTIRAPISLSNPLEEAERDLANLNKGVESATLQSLIPQWQDGQSNRVVFVPGRKGFWAGCEGSVPRAVSLTLTEVGPEGSVFAGKEKTWELSFDPSEPSEVTEL